MSIGTLYSDSVTRTKVPDALVKHFGLDVKIVKPDATYEKNFPLKRLPAFIGNDGFKLTETIAISLYCMYN